MELALAIVSPVTQIAGKLMMYHSKFKVNAKTLQELRDILVELMVQVEQLWNQESRKKLPPLTKPID
jgi:hypothetical protein